MFVEVCGLTNVGQIRKLNEDSFKIGGFENGKALGVCVLADGMGGHNAGDIASSVAANLLCSDLVERLGETDSLKISLNIAAAIDFANSEVYNMSLKNPEQAGMGTTIVVAYVNEERIRIANIGDSRAYLITDKIIKKITVDHSVVEDLVRSGSITRAQARRHPDKNIITRALGTEKFVDADYYDYIPKDGDTILLCSDGLWEMIDDKEIKAIVHSCEDVKATLEKLIDAANKSGGHDNITAVALQFKKEEK